MKRTVRFELCRLALARGRMWWSPIARGMVLTFCSCMCVMFVFLSPNIFFAKYQSMSPNLLIWGIFLTTQLLLFVVK